MLFLCGCLEILCIMRLSFLTILKIVPITPHFIFVILIIKWYFFGSSFNILNVCALWSLPFNILMSTAGFGGYFPPLLYSLDKDTINSGITFLKKTELDTSVKQIISRIILFLVRIFPAEMLYSK